MQFNMVHTGLLLYCIECTIHTKQEKKKALLAEAQLLVMLLAGTGII